MSPQEQAIDDRREEIIIAVSGDEGSFSHAAGIKYATDEGIRNARFRFAIDMERVFRALDVGEANIGVVPIHNSTTGLVVATIQAMGNGHRFELVCNMPILIEQCLLCFPETKPEEITHIVSHPQALNQCAGFINEHYPNVERVEYIDTALAARDLRDGKLDRNNTAVIASAIAAKIYKLEILDENIHDVHPNITTFIVVKK